MTIKSRNRQSLELTMERFTFILKKITVGVLLFFGMLVFSSCGKSFSDEEARALSQATIDQFFTALINQDETSFEDSFLDRTAYIANGSHIMSIRKDYEKFKDHDKKMAILRKNFQDSQAKYDSITIIDGNRAEFHSPWNKNDTRHFFLEPSGEQWKIVDIDHN